MEKVPDDNISKKEFETLFSDNFKRTLVTIPVSVLLGLIIFETSDDLNNYVMQPKINHHDVNKHSTNYIELNEMIEKHFLDGSGHFDTSFDAVLFNMNDTKNDESLSFKMTNQKQSSQSGTSKSGEVGCFCDKEFQSKFMENILKIEKNDFDTAKSVDDIREQVSRYIF